MLPLNSKHCCIQLLIIALIGLVFVNAQFPKSKYVFAHSKLLVGPDLYQMNWNYTKTQVIVELHVKTNGWLGFGLTKNGGMNGADVMIAWVDSNGKVIFTDRHIVDRNVMVDEVENWFLISGSKANGYTSIVFRRYIKTCDPNDEDLDIEEGSPKVIFAWGNDLPTSDISYHGPTNRGVSAVQFISQYNEEIVFKPEDNIKTFEFKVNASIPNDWQTYYHCEVFKLPVEIIQKKHHLLRIETKIAPGNEMYVHHWILQHCNHGFENEYLYNHSMPYGGNCFDESFTNSKNPTNTWNQVNHYCMSIAGGWAIGGNLIQSYPNGLGFPYGGPEGDFNYFVLQIHYSNVQLVQNVRDQSSVVFYFTDNLRKTEIGMFVNGAQSSWNAILIPPEQEAFALNYSCRRDCLSNLYDAGDITIFAASPHTHLQGIQVYTKLIRDGKEIGYVEKALSYDFDYQNTNFLLNPVVIKKNDELRTTCVYRTIGKKNYTYGGISTYQEMCLDFFLYYPRRPNVSVCASTYAVPRWAKFLANLNSTGDIVLSSNQITSDSLYYDIKNSLKSNADVTNKLLKFYSAVNQTQFCLGINTVTISDYPPLVAQPFIEINDCKNNANKIFINFSWFIVLGELLYLFS